MIPIKIQCGCGQKYAFDVEPVNGRMAAAVACPVCGADGTAAADAVLAQALAAQSAAVPASGARLRTATTTAAPPRIHEHSPGLAPPSSSGRTGSSTKMWKSICRIILALWMILIVFLLVMVAINGFKAASQKPEARTFILGFVLGRFVVGILFLMLLSWGFRKLGRK